MDIRAKRREEITLHNKFKIAINRVFMLLRVFMVVVSLLCMPPLFVWALYLTVTRAGLFDVLTVLAMMLSCLILNIVVEVR